MAIEGHTDNKARRAERAPLQRPRQQRAAVPHRQGHRRRAPHRRRLRSEAAAGRQQHRRWSPEEPPRGVPHPRARRGALEGRDPAPVAMARIAAQERRRAPTRGSPLAALLAVTVMAGAGLSCSRSGSGFVCTCTYLTDRDDEYQVMSRLASPRRTPRQARRAADAPPHPRARARRRRAGVQVGECEAVTSPAFGEVARPQLQATGYRIETRSLAGSLCGSRRRTRSNRERCAWGSAATPCAPAAHPRPRAEAAAMISRLRPPPLQRCTRGAVQRERRSAVADGAEQSRPRQTWPQRDALASLDLGEQRRAAARARVIAAPRPARVGSHAGNCVAGADHAA